jgi:hypothetical protein
LMEAHTDTRLALTTPPLRPNAQLRRPRPPRRTWLYAFISLPATALVAAALTRGYGLALVAAVALAAIWLLLIVDLSYVPAAALAAFVLLPTPYLSVNTYHGAVSPALGVVAILAVRAAIEGRPIRRGAHLTPLLLLAAWIVLRTVDSPIRTTSMTWSLAFVVLAIIPALFLPGWRRAQRHVEQCWLALGGVLGIYALVELILHRNPLFGSLFASGSLASAGGVYRVTTTLGDPLLNGVFFCLATLIGMGRILRGPTRWETGATLMSAVGLFATSSRGAVLALAVALVVFLGVVLSSRDEGLTRRAVLTTILVVAAMGVGGGLYLAKRVGSAEAAASTAVRLETFQAGEVLIRQYFPLGAGPGLTDKLKQSMPVGEYQRGVESSAFEIVIDLGLPGLLLVLWLFGAGAFTAIRKRPELTGAIVAYIVAASTFNLLDEYRPALLLWGLLIGLTVHAAPANPSRHVTHEL